MPTINGPNGTGATVNDENRLETSCVTETAEHHTNREEGEAYTWYFSDDADVGDDCIFYLKNTDDKELILEGIDLYVTSDEEVYLKVGGTGTTASGATTVVGTNLNAGSGNVADCIALHHGDIESGATFAGGVECNRYKYTEGTTYDTHHVNFPMDIVIPKNQVFSLWCATAGVVVNGTLYGFFHD